MASSKYENIWKLITTYDFKEEIPTKFHCLLCKKVAIEPFGSLCGCRFCFDCISIYLKDGNKHCPGKKPQCIEEILEMNVNVSKDLVLIQRITEIIVNCPNKMCEVKCVLKSMSDHLRVCGMSSNKCLYETMGCQGQMSSDSLKTHYDNDWFIHSQLMIEAFENLRNEFKGLKVIVEKKDNEILQLNKDSERKDMVIKEMKKEINDQKIDIETFIHEDRRKDGEMESMKEEFKKMIEKSIMKEFDNIKKDRYKNYLDINAKINELKEQMDNQGREIEGLKVKDKRRNREIEVMKETQKKTMMEELKIIKKDIAEMNVIGDMLDPKKSLNDLKVNHENIERVISSIILKVKDSRIYDEREFIWRVNYFSKMRDDCNYRRVILWRYSLKLCLTLWCYGDSFGFYCRILNGEFDDDLNWPMKHKITLSMINQDTMEVYKSKEYHYDSFEYKLAFNKPKSEMNNKSREYRDRSKSAFDVLSISKNKNKDKSYLNFIGDSFGDFRFMTVKDITDSPGLLLNDSLIVSFNIDYKN